MKLGIIFGGVSYEHEISIVSAIAMKDVINTQIQYIFLDENREFYHIPTDTIKSKLFSSKDYKKCQKIELYKDGFYTQGSFLSKPKKIEVDTYLNMMHGADGEDGVISSLLEFNNLSYIGPRKEACSVSFNKFLTKGYSLSVGVKTIDYKYFTRDDKVNIDNFPVIIKPVRLGSSIGVSVVKSNEELEYALDVAFEFDDAIIVEPFINGIKEYNLAGCKINNEFEFSIIEEPQKAEFLDFDKKYLDFARTSTALKADISKELEEKIKKSFKDIYNTLFDGALIRCDFFVKDNEVYLNEINPVPGSMANYLFSNFDEIIKKLSKSLPKTRKILINYDYVNKIQASKGK